MNSESLHRVGCLPDCGYEAEASDERVVVEEMTTHMWDAHRLRVDPLDVREMLQPVHRTSRRGTKASASAESQVSSRSVREQSRG